MSDRAAPGLAFGRRLRRSSLSVKLAALGATVTGVVVALVFWALSAQVRANSREVFSHELERNQRTLREQQSRDAQQLVSAAEQMTGQQSFQYDLSIYRVEGNFTGKRRTDLVNTMEDELRGRLRASNADLLIVTDDSGRVFASASRDGGAMPQHTNLFSLPALRHVLDPTTAADTGALAVMRTDGGYFEVAVYPLVQDGFTLGSLILGRRLDATFVAGARATSNADVVLTVGDSVIAASDPQFQNANVARALSQHAASANAVTLHLGDDDYVVGPVSLGDSQGGASVRLWMLEPLSTRVAALTKPLRRQFVLFGAIAVLVAAFGSMLVARTVLGPFRRFVQYMRSAASSEKRQGGFPSESESVEVRTLNESFDHLMDSLAARRHELEQRTAELVAANVVLTDEVSERVRVEQALRESQAQLRQSQKLEAIGTLAGGIAHDFNNLITVISGYTQLALMRAEPGSRAANDLQQVVEASDRAANLTHQLLAFSRKQVLQPTVLDMSDVVKGIAPMLRRIIGEHIELKIDSVGPLARIRADRGQLEQVLLNLAVNARDAMQGGGTLTLGTRNVPDAGDAESATAVALIVADTGSGMSDEVKERVFEPFFTTKDPGKGTGLGLSTVYGIVNQSGGAIVLESELGLGTSFTITLPIAETVTAAETKVGSDSRIIQEADLPNGTETVLIVEDAEDVRILARRTLEERGYNVLVARNAEEALEIGGAGHIDVLLTDIIMPKTSGPELVTMYLAVHPAPLVIYMSGYADDALVRYELDPSTVFLRKPFTPALLARTLRAALDSARPPRDVGSAAD